MLIVETTASAGPRKCRGVVDGSNKLFGVQSIVDPYSLVVKLNGVTQTQGLDYSLVWEALGNIEFVTAPSSGTPDVVGLEYHKFGSV